MKTPPPAVPFPGCYRCGIPGELRDTRAHRRECVKPAEKAERAARRRRERAADRYFAQRRKPQP
jgi:hypothetical protein